MEGQSEENRLTKCEERIKDLENVVMHLLNYFQIHKATPNFQFPPSFATPLSTNPRIGIVVPPISSGASTPTHLPDAGTSTSVFDTQVTSPTLVAPTPFAPLQYFSTPFVIPNSPVVLNLETDPTSLSREALRTRLSSYDPPEQLRSLTRTIDINQEERNPLRRSREIYNEKKDQISAIAQQTGSDPYLLGCKFIYIIAEKHSNKKRKTTESMGQEIQEIQEIQESQESQEFF